MIVVKELREYDELLAQELVGKVDLWRECGVSLRERIRGESRTVVFIIPVPCVRIELAM